MDSDEATGEKITIDNRDIPYYIRQRCVIEFCYLLGKKAPETYSLLRYAYGKKTLSRGRVFLWWKHFNEGSTNVNDKYRSGRPSVTTAENMAQAKKIMEGNKHISLRNMARLLHVSPGGAKTIMDKLEEERTLFQNTDSEVSVDDDDLNEKDPLSDAGDKSEDILTRGHWMLDSQDSQPAKKRKAPTIELIPGTSKRPTVIGDIEGEAVNFLHTEMSVEDYPVTNIKVEPLEEISDNKNGIPGNHLQNEINIEDYPVSNIKVECLDEIHSDTDGSD